MNLIETKFKDSDPTS